MPLLFNKTIRAGLAVAALALLPLSGTPAQAAAPWHKKKTPARKQPAITTEKDQVDLAVTVYNSNIGASRARRSPDPPPFPD